MLLSPNSLSLCVLFTENGEQLRRWQSFLEFVHVRLFNSNRVSNIYCSQVPRSYQYNRWSPKAWEEEEEERALRNLYRCIHFIVSLLHNRRHSSIDISHSSMWKGWCLWSNLVVGITNIHFLLSQSNGYVHTNVEIKLNVYVEKSQNRTIPSARIIVGHMSLINDSLLSLLVMLSLLKYQDSVLAYNCSFTSSIHSSIMIMYCRKSFVIVTVYSTPAVILVLSFSLSFHYSNYLQRIHIY